MAELVITVLFPKLDMRQLSWAVCSIMIVAFGEADLSKVGVPKPAIDDRMPPMFARVPVDHSKHVFRRK